MKTIIFQTSPPHTASTVLVNILYGLIPHLKDKPIIYIDNKESVLTNNNVQNIFNGNDLIVIKTHIINIDEWVTRYGKEYNLYFIASTRKDRNLLLDKKYKNYKNLIVFSFNSLNETENNTIYNIVKNVHDRIQNVLDIELNIENAVNRIVSMNNLYETIKGNDFKYYDDFYHIHGSHRNRK
jgi:hypothetical protein